MPRMRPWGERRRTRESAAEARRSRLDHADQETPRRGKDGRGGEGTHRVPCRISRSRAAAAARPSRLEAGATLVPPCLTMPSRRQNPKRSVRARAAAYGPARAMRPRARRRA
jgi:hypothetical protein